VTPAEAVVLGLFWSVILLACLLLRLTLPARAAVPTPPDAEPISFQATDGVWLSGWQLASDLQHPWVILCHSAGRHRGELFSLAQRLATAHFNCLLFDFRAHGQSHGRTVAYGWREHHDLQGALAWLGKQADIPDRPFGIVGRELGAFVALTVAATDDRLYAIVAESPPRSAIEVMALRIRATYRIPRLLGHPLAAMFSRLRFGRPPASISKLSTQLAERVILLIHHAAHDPHERVTRSLVPPAIVWETGLDKERSTAGHQAYAKQVIGFLRQHLQESRRRR